MKLYKTVTAPDLQIRGEPSHPDPEEKGGGGGGGGGLQKKMFQPPFGPQFGLTIRGEGWGGGGGPSPGSITAKVTVKIEIVQKVKHSKKYICL